MVAVHGISMDRIDNGPAEGAVAFSLAKAPNRGRIHRFPAEGWEIELRSGSEYVVARTGRSLAGSALVDAAIDHTHRALDLSSVEDGEHLVTATPADGHIAFELAAGRRIVRVHAVADVPVAIDLSITVTRADGSVEPPPIHPALVWAPAFRFHRLSQSSGDLFDAYRNLFLGLEALLDQVFPKTRKEGEKQWLLRSVAAAGARVDLARIARPGAVDPVQDLVDRIYGIRVQLFHAKIGRALIPDDSVSYTEVAQVYPTLLELWTEIVRGWLSLKRGGGVITHQGFRLMIERSYSSVDIGVTADDSAAVAEETSPSPCGLPVAILGDPVRLTEVQPGRMGLFGSTDISALPVDQVVGRILILGPQGAPYMINSIKGGLTLNGADRFETVSIMRLVNRYQPRTEFN